MTRSFPPSVQAIIDAVAKDHGITSDDILSDKRARVYCWPRQEAFAKIRAQIKINGAPPSYPRIGDWLGFDHTTVLHGVREHRARIVRADYMQRRMKAYHRQLVQVYGRDRAKAIMEGRDRAANADLASWNAFGTARAAA